MGRRPLEPHAVQAKAVVIEDIDDLGRAMCIDQFGFRHTLFRNTTRAKGMYPAVGEKWMIDRTIAGTWTFACLLVPNPPTISGTRSANSALGNLISALAEGGLIIDETTEGTGGSGVTDHGELDGLADDDHPQYAKAADLGSAAVADIGDFATAAQGDLADSAVQPGDIGSAAGADIGDFATAAQGALAGSAVQPTATTTLTNKRITKRVTTITSSATPTINTDNCDAVTITALSTAITSMTTNLTGTPSNFDSLVFRIKDDGSARAITWGASFASRGATLPTTTTAGKVTYVGFFYNSVTSTWDCTAVVTEA